MGVQISRCQQRSTCPPTQYCQRSCPVFNLAGLANGALSPPVSQSVPDGGLLPEKAAVDHFFMTAI
jgi:hypothetical protein